MATPKWPKGVTWDEGSVSVRESEWAWNDAEQNLSDLVHCMRCHSTPDRQMPAKLSFVGNVLGDSSADVLAMFLKEFPSSCIELNLRRCRITERGLRILAETAAASPRPVGGRRIFNLEGNPIEDPIRAQLHAQQLCPDLVLQLSIPWTPHNGKAALDSKQTWRDYMHGPSSLLRLQLEEHLPSGSKVTCPVCIKLLGTAPWSQDDAAASQARTHLMSDGHRKQLWKVRDSSPVWSIDVGESTYEFDLCSGEQRWLARPSIEQQPESGSGRKQARASAAHATNRSRSPPRFGRYRVAMNEEVNKCTSSSVTSDTTRGGVGQHLVRLKRPLSLTECWHAWLLCQPAQSLHRRRWPDPASWVFWHIECWEARLQRSRQESDDQIFHDAEESALRDCSPAGCYNRLNNVGDNWKISVSPFDILFSQGNISSVFGGGAHRQHAVDRTIREILSGEVDYTAIPEIDVFELDGRLYALTGNRRLFVMRVLACKGVVETMTVVLRDQRDPELHRLKHDRIRLHSLAPKWERHLSSDTNGLVVRISSPGSSFEAYQALPPCPNWRERL